MKNYVELFGHLADDPTFYEEDETAATQIFSNETAIQQLMDGNVDETKSVFELITVSGDSVKADWKTPLCDQPEIKEELARLDTDGQIPTFVVCLAGYVA